MIIPSNERLAWTQFSHFPVGGPTPEGEYIGSKPTLTENNRVNHQSSIAADAAVSFLSASNPNTNILFATQKEETAEFLVDCVDFALRTN